MARKRGFRIRVSHQRIKALLEICQEMHEEFIPRGEHQVLLQEYLTELLQKLPEMLRRNQALYTVMLSGAEAIAFSQLWNMLDISRDKYATIVVKAMLEKMGNIAA